MKETASISRDERPIRIEVIDRASTAVLRKMTGGQRVEAACRLFSAAQAMLRHRLTREHPEWTPAAVDVELARRISSGAT